MTVFLLFGMLSFSVLISWVLAFMILKTLLSLLTRVKTDSHAKLAMKLRRLQLHSDLREIDLRPGNQVEIVFENIDGGERDDIDNLTFGKPGPAKFHRRAIAGLGHHLPDEIQDSGLHKVSLSCDSFMVIAPIADTTGNALVALNR